MEKNLPYSKIYFKLKMMLEVSSVAVKDHQFELQKYYKTGVDVFRKAESVVNRSTTRFSGCG